MKEAEAERARRNAARAETLLHSLRQPTRALALISEALAVRPKQARWYLVRAQLYRVMGRNRLALADYNSNIRLTGQVFVLYLSCGSMPSKSCLVLSRHCI